VKASLKFLPVNGNYFNMNGNENRNVTGISWHNVFMNFFFSVSWHSSNRKYSCCRWQIITPNHEESMHRTLNGLMGEGAGSMC
jgi:hypothetical protein